MSVIGSNNGVGKTLLLQFIYALLTQSDSSDNHLLKEFIHEYLPLEVSSNLQALAVISIWDEERKIEQGMEFYVIKGKDGVELMSVKHGLSPQVYLLMHSCDQHTFLKPDGKSFFYYEDMYGPVPACKYEGMGKRKEKAILDWVRDVLPPKSIVLMDNPDLFLHSDCVYELCSNLQHNFHKEGHFIVATHSYEFCQALTPSQVFELR